MPLSREQVRALLDASGGASGDLFDLIHEEHRKRNHEIAKLTQPDTLTVLHEDDLGSIRAFCLAPVTAEEQTQSGLHYLCQTVKDALTGGDSGDILYALARVWRKAWAVQPALGPIEGAAQAAANLAAAQAEQARAMQQNQINAQPGGANAR